MLASLINDAYVCTIMWSVMAMRVNFVPHRPHHWLKQTLQVSLLLESLRTFCKGGGDPHLLALCAQLDFNNFYSGRDETT
jgi:hypothetical protein